MYYNHVQQPDGVPAIGINLEMQPPIREEPEPEPEPEPESVYERTDILFTKISHVTIFCVNCLFTLILYNILNIINLILSMLCLYGISKEDMKYVYFHTVYLIICLIMAIYVVSDVYIIYYSTYTVLNLITIEQYS